MTYADFKTLCETRHSVREFEDTPVTPGEITELLELARLAPSIDNLQPWRFHVIYNKDQRSELMEACCYGNFVAGASVLIIVTADLTVEKAATKVLWNPKEVEYSCITAMEHIWLGAVAMGLGGSWVSLHHGKPHAVLGLPPDEVVIGGILIGHPKKGVSIQPSSRKDLEEMMTIHE
ncbi:MAG: nitroreductase family protein [Patescibacteria group bacterium]